MIGRYVLGIMHILKLFLLLCELFSLIGFFYLIYCLCQVQNANCDEPLPVAELCVAARCARGDHEPWLDEQIGIICRQCGHVIQDIKDIDPEFVSQFTYLIVAFSLFTSALVCRNWTFGMFRSIFVARNLNMYFSYLKND